MPAPWMLAALLAVTPAAPPAEDPPTQTTAAAPSGERIAWYGTLEAALDEAARTERPIFLLSARPEFREVPGFW